MSKLDKNIQKIREYLLKEGPPNPDIRENPKNYSGGNFDDCFEYGMEYGRSELAEEILGLISRISDEDVSQEEFSDSEETVKEAPKSPPKPRGRPKKSS